jgi:two-component system, chemotaxis family, protein-glutamate methylesterase/glutaminase
VTRGSHDRRVAAVAIGCSAGGIEALSALLPAFAPDCGVAALVVVHLPRERPSRLVDVFESKCRLVVSEAEDKQPIQAGHLYFAPPDYHLLVDDGPRLALSVDEVVHFSRPAVDVLFESAADAYGAELMAVVLSGANQDGARGLAAVERAGGLTLVQRPETAVAAAMPSAALAATHHSLVLDLPGIADMLRTLRSGLCPGSAFEPRTSR